jgi:hypothetical protein
MIDEITTSDKEWASYARRKLNNLKMGGKRKKNLKKRISKRRRTSTKKRTSKRKRTKSSLKKK